MYSSFPVSYPFGKGENKEFWLLSVKVEGKLPASTITTSLNTFPLNPSLNTFFLLNCQAVNILGQINFSFLKRNRSYCGRKKKASTSQSTEYKWVSVQCCPLNNAMCRGCSWSKEGTSWIQPGPVPNYQQSLGEMSPSDQVSFSLLVLPWTNEKSHFWNLTTERTIQ